MNSLANYINKLKINYSFSCISGWFNVYNKNNLIDKQKYGYIYNKNNYGNFKKSIRNI